MGQDPLIGKVLHDTHEVVRMIGQGGMGSVYEAVHKRLRKQRFAIKVLHQKMAESASIFTRFQREAEIATEIGHPNIVYVLDFYETEEGLPCMVMEYLEGQDLDQRLRQQQRLCPAEVLNLVEQVGGALQAVHDKGVVHRDLKPANIFLVSRPDGTVKVKVLDFGISKIRDSSTLTGDSAVLGTPHYMSPEQGEGQVKDVDHRTDIFALGTICYQALSGARPFDAPTLLGVIRAICDKQPLPVTDHLPQLGPHVNAVLQRALAKRKEQRYDRVDQFLADLRASLEPVVGLPADSGEIPVASPAAVSGDTISDEVAQAVTVARAPIAAAPPQDINVTNLMGIDEVLGEAVTANLPSPQIRPASPLTTLSGAAGQSPAAAVPHASSSRTTTMAVAAVAVVLLVAGGLYLALRSPDRRPAGATPVVAASHPAPARARPPKIAARASAPLEQKAPPAPPGPKAAPVSVVAPAPAPEPRMVVITLRLTPSGARVLLDGKPRTDNPLKLQQGNRKHQLRFEARGYRPLSRTVRATSSAALTIRLKRLRPARAGARRRPRGSSEEGFDALGAPRARPRPRPQPKKDDEEAFDNL